MNGVSNSGNTLKVQSKYANIAPTIINTVNKNKFPYAPTLAILVSSSILPLTQINISANMKNSAITSKYL